MKTSVRPIVAFVGPSFVGKGHLKKTVMSELEQFDIHEPVVATTRAVRPGEEAYRDAGLSEEEFDARVAMGIIVLPHRPFRRLDSPRYGFVADSFNPDKNQLTEVHSSILGRFRAYIDGRPSMVIGLIAGSQTLQLNMKARQATGVYESNNAQRMNLVTTEIDEIYAGVAQGHVDMIIPIQRDKHIQSTASLVSKIGELYGSV